MRGYTLFTQDRGDEAAAKLAAKFAPIPRDGVEARGSENRAWMADEHDLVDDAVWSHR